MNNRSLLKVLLPSTLALAFGLTAANGHAATWSACAQAANINYYNNSGGFTSNASTWWTPNYCSMYQNGNHAGWAELDFTPTLQPQGGLSYGAPPPSIVSVAGVWVTGASSAIMGQAIGVNYDGSLYQTINAPPQDWSGVQTEWWFFGTPDSGFYPDHTFFAVWGQPGVNFHSFSFETP